MNEKHAKILVVEDEPAIQQGLCDVLTFNGFEPTPVGNGEDGLREGRTGAYALVLLDVMLPGLNGFEVCAALRAELPRLPILMLTARGAEDDVLAGFRAGSDDYVTKPFSISQLMARVEALLRRAGGLLEDAPEPFMFGRFRVDPTRRVIEHDGQLLELSARELGMLALFAREQGRIVSRRLLLRELWQMDADRVETRTVDMHVAKLRKKLGEEGRALIATVRGEGYRFG